MKKTEKKPVEPVKVEMTINGPVKNSETREKFLKLMESYKLKNPVKYEHKKAALEKHLATL
jgi:hypothetical protein